MKVRFPKLRGFTLTELLVALIISSLILTLLLAFTVTLTRTNQEEDAKASSQDEVTAALNYIANDLQEAVFIYGATGLNNDSTNTTSPGIRDQIYRPSGVSALRMRPVLVFWKRNFLQPNDTFGPTDKTVRCFGYNRLADPGETDCFGQARFVYSLVSYSIRIDTEGDRIRKLNNPLDPGVDVWSPTARIVRHEVRDGIRWSCANPNPPSNSNCPPQLDRNGNTWTTGSDYEIPPDPGFRLFDLSGSGSLESKMNRWTTDGAYNGNVNGIEVLIDNIDDIPGTRTIFGESQKMSDFLQLPVCDSPETGLEQGIGATLVPTLNLSLGEGQGVNALSSFYACVANFGTPSKSLARIWLRGNFASRLTPDRNQRQGGDPLNGTTTSDITVLARGVFKTED